MSKIMKEKDEYNAFNIIVGNFTTNNFYYICNKYEGGNFIIIFFLKIFIFIFFIIKNKYL